MTGRTSMVVGALALAGALAVGYGVGHRVPATVPQVAAEGAAAQAQPRLLYYRNPMGLPDTSPVPKKDPMGMDYLPVYAGESAAEPTASYTVSIRPDKVQQLGVRTEPVALRVLERSIRAAGRVEVDERRVAMVAPKFEGYVEKLWVNVTGQSVAKGQPLMEVYAPELVSLQREYAIAVQAAASLNGADSPAQQGMQRLVDSSLQRLKNWDISEEQLKALVASGETRRTMTLRSPVAGIVTEKKAVQGMRFMPGEGLFQLTDLSSVWVIADVAEQDIAGVRPGAKARIRLQAFPERVFTATVAYIYPTLKAETRTVPVRLELPNPGALLKPFMYAQVELPIGERAAVLSVPLSAVIDSGTRQVALVQQGPGKFAPRTLVLGARSDTHVAVLQGLKEGESVVVAANFLIDAESNLKAALDGLGATVSAAPPVSAAGHRAHGTVDSVDPREPSTSIRHDAVASLKWPAMTMEFKLANTALLAPLKPGAVVDFEFVERAPGEWVITAVQPAGADTHASH